MLALLLMSALTFAEAPAGSYQIDSAHTNVGFEVGHLAIGSVVGRFNRFGGTIVIDGANSKAVIDIDVSSIDTNVAQRDSHLRSEDFFDVAKYPTMRFESTRLNGDQLEGNLTLHGVTRPLTLKVITLGNGVGPVGETRAGFKAEGTIKRSEFGMNRLLAIAGDEVTIKINVEGIKQ